MTIIYVPFDTDIFWEMLVLFSVFAFVGFMLQLGKMYGGINPYRGFP
jgi:hypothetical protein